MIIDTNTHLGHWPFRKLAHADAASFLQLLDSFGVAQAWVGAFEGIFYRDCAQANRDLLAEIAGHEDRLVPWAAINPNFPGWHDDLAEAAEAGFAGVRLYPNYHNYALLSDCAFELLAELEDQGLPVAIYQKVVDERLHHWHCKVAPTEMTLAPLVKRFPKLTIIYCGGTLPAAADLPAGVYMEVSRLEGIGGVADLARAITPERVLFGSHAPYFYLAAALLKLAEADLTEPDREAILHGNAQRLLAG
jgi:predicted TIM-barrel fold metal-dependent hydrolase